MDLSSQLLEKLSWVATKTDNSVVITDKEGCIEWVNEGFVKMTEYTLDEVKGKRPGSMLQGPNTDPKHQQLISDRLFKKQPVEQEILNYSKSGREYWIHLSIVPVENDEGILTNFISIQSDVSAKKKSRMELERLLTEKEELTTQLMMSELKFKSAFKQEKNINDTLKRTIDKLKSTQEQLMKQEKLASIGTLTASIAHEMNNPVNFVYNGISSLDDLLNDLKLYLGELEQVIHNSQDPVVIEQAQQVSEAHEINEIVEDLGAISAEVADGSKRIVEIAKGLRVFSRTDEDEILSTDINELLDSVIILLKGNFKYSIELSKEFDRSLPSVDCYPGQLNQVFMNLISNAIHAIPQDRKDGQITVKTKDFGSDVIIEIKDNGTGMPQSVQDKIFKPFFTTKEVGVGTGLGMGISKDIVEKHGGSLRFESLEGEGTSFYIQIPKRADAQVQSA